MKKIILLVLVLLSVNCNAQDENFVKWVLSFPVKSNLICDLYKDTKFHLNEVLRYSNDPKYKKLNDKYRNILSDSIQNYCKRNDIEYEPNNVYENINFSNGNLSDSLKSLKQSYWIEKEKKTPKKPTPNGPIQTHGIGNGTFKISPKMLSSIFIETPTLKTVEATLSSWTSNQDVSDQVNGKKTYDCESLRNSITVEYNINTNKVEKLRIQSCSETEVMSFKQKLIVLGYYLNPRSSDLANSINQGIGGMYEFYSKEGSKITFVLKPNQITIFK